MTEPPTGFNERPTPVGSAGPPSAKSDGAHDDHDDDNAVNLGPGRSVSAGGDSGVIISTFRVAYMIETHEVNDTTEDSDEAVHSTAGPSRKFVGHEGAVWNSDEQCSGVVSRRRGDPPHVHPEVIDINDSQDDDSSLMNIPSPQIVRRSRQMIRSRNPRQ